MGYFAGIGITTGVNNTTIGALAGDALTDADNNTAVGRGALADCRLGSKNVAVGDLSLSAANPSTAANTYNTAIGCNAGSAITTGTLNVCVGGDSGLAGNLVTGAGNVLLGQYSHTSATDANYANGLGYDINAEAGYTTLGKSTDDIRAAHGNVTWATVSDRRVKKDIEDSTAGLNFINDLRPRTFKYKAKGELPQEFNSYEEGSTEAYKNSKTNHGFIAQEVKEVIDNHPEIYDGFSMWNVRESGQQEVGEAAVIPVLVKAIQELSTQVEKLKVKLGE